MRVGLEIWRKDLESKGFKISCRKKECMNYNFRGDMHRIETYDAYIRYGYGKDTPWIWLHNGFNTKKNEVFDTTRHDTLLIFEYLGVIGSFEN